MRHRRNGTLTRLGAVAGGAALLLGGCAHNDVLVFGTSTTIGLNIESVSAEGAPSIVLGYEREEAVWMPLVLNGNDSRLLLCAADDQGECATGSVPVGQAMYRSEVEYGDGRVRRDTYSVFASLGARFSGDANRDGVGAGGGLAQFFATGNAAVNITENEALVTALKVESAEGAAAQAEAVQGAALSEERLAALQADHDARAAEITFIVRCGADPDARWNEMVDRAYPEGATERARQLARSQLRDTPPAERAQRFIGHNSWIEEMAKAAVAEGCTR